MPMLASTTAWRTPLPTMAGQGPDLVTERRNEVLGGEHAADEEDEDRQRA